MSYIFSELTKLPASAQQQIHSQMWNYKGSHLSILETSHRSANFAAVNNWTMDQLRSYLGVPANYKILLMQGGVELVWASVAYNLYYNAKEKNLKAKYVVSGPRSRKAAIEAGKIMGEEKVVLETVDKMVEGDDNEYLYSYFCMNDIQNGYYLPTIPKLKAKSKVLDCSSVLGLIPIQISNFDLLIASAQHSLGMVGCTITIVHDSLILQNPLIPSMFNYQVMLRTNSIFNTPNCFAVYVMGFYVNFLMKEYGTPVKAEEKMRELHGLMMKAIEGSHLTMRFEGGSGASVKTIVLQSKDEKRMKALRERLENQRLIADQGESLIVHLQLTNTVEEMKRLHDLLLDEKSN